MADFQTRGIGGVSGNEDTENADINNIKSMMLFINHTKKLHSKPS